MSDLYTLFDFFLYAVGVGVVLSIVCASLGVFVILKRVVFIGITLSEVAAAGLAGGFLIFHALLGMESVHFDHYETFATTGTAIIATTVAVTILAYCGGLVRIPQEAVSGILFVVAGAGSVLLVSYSSFGLEEVKDLLWGNLLVAQGGDLLVGFLVLVPLLIGILLFKSYFLLASVDRDFTKLMGHKPRLWDILFFYTLGVVVAIGSKIGGSLLVFAYLVAPSSAALILCNRINSALIMAGVLAAVSTLAGLYFSIVWDAPASQLVIMFLGVECVLAGAIRQIVAR